MAHLRAGKYRACFRSSITDGNYHIHVFRHVRQLLCVVMRDIDPDFSHHFHRQGVQRGRLRTGAINGKEVTPKGAGESFRRLTARGVASAEK